MLSRCFFDFSVDVGAFVIGLSQNFSFFSYEIRYHFIPRHFNLISIITDYSLLQYHNKSHD